MRATLTPFILILWLEVLAQGFSTSATNWGLPAGGTLDNGVNYGFNALSGAASNLEDQGSQSWNLVDMDGDGLTDLVVPAEVTANGYTQEFIPNSNSFWKVYQNTGSGFSTSATNCGLPAGGMLQNGITYGFYSTSGQSASFQDQGTRSWDLVNMNGDVRPDLVVNAEKGSSGYVQEFIPNSNS
jgi:hypothetical protein